MFHILQFSGREVVEALAIEQFALERIQVFWRRVGDVFVQLCMVLSCQGLEPMVSQENKDFTSNVDKRVQNNNYQH